MAKFNEVQKKRRAEISKKKRALYGDPNTKKLKRATQSQSVSGKRQRKLLRKWRRDQKIAIEKGLVTLDDVEMAAADGPSESKKTPAKFHLKKSVKLKSKQRKQKGKSKGVSSNPAVQAAPVDVMME
ncbi:Hamartin [Bienertia sinuspersici]